MNTKIFLHRHFSALLIILALTAFMNIPTHAAMRTVAGIVTKVSDGDTIQVTTPEQTKLKVRLYGIDAPESPKVNAHSGQVNKQGQPYGEESWMALEGKVKGAQVKLDVIDIENTGTWCAWSGSTTATLTRRWSRRATPRRSLNI
jgi:endonuclease YncB( thermonuclease family)